MNEFDWSDLDARLLRVLVAVQEAGSVTAASYRLGTTQSAVSHSLDKLRTITSDPLFVKSGRGIVATACAEALAVRAREREFLQKNLPEHVHLQPLRSHAYPARGEPWGDPRARRSLPRGQGVHDAPEYAVDLARSPMWCVEEVKQPGLPTRAANQGCWLSDCDSAWRERRNYLMTGCVGNRVIARSVSLSTPVVRA